MTTYSTFRGALRSHLGGPRSDPAAKPFQVKAAAVNVTPDLDTAGAGAIAYDGVLPAGVSVIGIAVLVASAGAGTVDIKARHPDGTLDIIAADVDCAVVSRSTMASSTAEVNRVLEITSKTGVATQTAIVEIEMIAVDGANAMHWPQT